MYVLLGISSIGLFIYLYNSNNSTIIYNFINIFSKLENCYLDITNYFKNNKINIEKINNSIFIVNYICINKNLKQIVDFKNRGQEITLNDPKFKKLISCDIFNDTNIDKYLSYKSPIIGCHICIINDTKRLEIDITDFFNEFVLYNCKIILSSKYNKNWIDILNKYLHINIDYKDNLILEWKIILDNISIYEGTELTINLENGIIDIANNINSIKLV